MSKDALWLTATVLVSVVIGVGAAYYFLVYKKPAALRTGLSVSSIVAVGSAAPGSSFNKRENDLGAEILRLRMVIDMRKETLRISSKDRVAIVKKLIAEDEASLKQAEKEYEQYSKANPNRIRR